MRNAVFRFELRHWDIDSLFWFRHFRKASAANKPIRLLREREIQNTALFMSSTPADAGNPQAGVGKPDSRFAPTRWSVVLNAGRGDSPEGRRALEELCRIYWRPVYRYVRGRVANSHDAEDWTQE